MDIQRVLFVCIHNSARSQMAEAYLNRLGAGKYRAESAGLEPGTLNPYVVKVLREDGIDISGHTTQGVQALITAGRSFDQVITVCDEARAERCPMFPGKAQRLHWSFPDPSSFVGSDDQKLIFTRKVRDQIKARIQGFIKESGHD